MIDKNTKLLSMCSSFRRPGMLIDMVKSFYETRSPGTELFIYLHLDDPLIDEYRKVAGGLNVVFGEHRFLQEFLNHTVFERYPEIPYYQVICDDHIYRTPQWDNLLIDALNKTNDWGFSCARDLVNNDNWEEYEHPSAEIFSWKQASLLGYAYPRGFKQTGMDLYAKDLGKSIGALTLVREATIEHLWYDGSDKPKDDNLKENYSTESFKHAWAVYNEWKGKERSIAVGKIMEARKHEAENR